MCMLGALKLTATVQLYGVFQNASSLSIYRQAINQLDAIESDDGIQLKPNSGLNEMISNSENMRQNISQNDAEKYIFTDLEPFKTEIITEVLSEVNQSTNSTVHINSDFNGQHQVRYSLIDSVYIEQRYVILHNCEN